MRRIVDAAGDRPLTKAQTSDFDIATKEALGLVIDADPDAVQELFGAMKSAGSLADAVDGFERWSERNAGGRKSAGRIINEDGPIGGSTFGSPGAAYGTKALDWGRDFVQERTRASKALLEIGSTAVESPIFAEPIADARQAKFVYELMPSSEAEGGAFGYLRQTARTNNAAEVAAGALKPTSVYTLERVTDTVKVWAHVTEPLDRYLLEDAPNLRQFLNQELRHGLAKAFDAHVITDVSAAATAGPITLNLANIRTAITTLQGTDLEPTAIVVNPTDWEAIESSAATQFASNDNFPAATEALNRRLYGVPVVVTNSALAGQAIVGDFSGSGRIFRTGTASVTIHDSQPRDVTGTLYADYRLNQLVLRAEMRAEVAPWRGSGFVRVGPA